MDAESRIAQLEERLAFQDDAINQLSDVMFEQGKMLDRLRARLEAMSNRMEEFSERLPDDGPAHQPPPHY